MGAVQTSTVLPEVEELLHKQKTTKWQSKHAQKLPEIHYTSDLLIRGLQIPITYPYLQM